MREDIVTPATARRLATEGFTWEPEIGDWCTVLGAAHVGEARVGLWLVAAIYPQTGLLGLMDATGQWPATQVPQRDCLWLPTIGKLKAWLRSQGYRVATGETVAALLGATVPTPRHWTARVSRNPRRWPMPSCACSAQRQPTHRAPVGDTALYSRL